MATQKEIDALKEGIATAKAERLAVKGGSHTSKPVVKRNVMVIAVMEDFQYVDKDKNLVTTDKSGNKLVKVFFNDDTDEIFSANMVKTLPNSFKEAQPASVLEELGTDKSGAPRWYKRQIEFENAAKTFILPSDLATAKALLS